MATRRLLRFLALATIAMTWPAAGLAAQDGEGELIGDWRVGGSTDPFDDSVRQAYMYLVREDHRSIQAVAIACVAGGGDPRLELRIVHPYLIPDRDDENLVQVRFGAAESRTAWGSATTSNTRTDLRIAWPDIEALRAEPNLAVRITEGASHSHDQYTESWTGLARTEEAIRRALAHCAPA